jgi:hypothetical protein
VELAIEEGAAVLESLRAVEDAVAVGQALCGELSLIGISVGQAELLEQLVAAAGAAFLALEEQLEGGVAVLGVLRRGDAGEVGEVLDGLRGAIEVV